MARKSLITAIVITVVIGFLVWLVIGAQTSYSTDPKSVPQDVAEWDTKLESVGYQTQVPQDVKSYKTRVRYVKGPHASCKRRVISVTAKNAWGWGLFKAYQSAYWCGKGRDITTANINRWGTTAPFGEWTLWRYEGVSDTVRNKRRNADGIQYVYARTYYRFERGFKEAVQQKFPWLSMTVRADMSCSYDKIEQSSQYSCA